ncbi:MAG: hypothetical protein LBC38_01120 [Oscillospiraceae bacterium]|jgi:hypothetical protein|nr:hypothetical protein [Oscillospiraceae bacterium]
MKKFIIAVLWLNILILLAVLIARHNDGDAHDAATPPLETDALIITIIEPDPIVTPPPMYETPFGWSASEESAKRQWEEWYARQSEALLSEPEIPQEYITAIADCFAGEEFDSKSERKAVIAQVICNRAALWDMDVIDVLENTGFAGYGHPSRTVSDDDIAVATEVLSEWYANDCKTFPGELLYFDHVNGSFVTAQTYTEFVQKRKDAKR